MNNKNKIKSIAMVLGIILLLSTINLGNFQTDQREVLSNQVLDDDFPKSSQPPITLRYGVIAGPALPIDGNPGGLDPHYIWDSASFDVIDQVVERLFADDLSHPEMQPIPRLASDYGTWSGDGLTYTVPLRQRVTFHDGTPFNADAVIWNFERLNYFMNLEVGNLLPPGTPESQFSSLYLWPDGTPIIDMVNYINENEVEFVLNRPYAPFIALLCFSGSGFMSPDSTPTDDEGNHLYIDTFGGSLIGTGPFAYGEFIENEEVRFHANDYYWDGAPNINELIFSIIPDTTERTQALLDGNIDFIKDPDYSMLQDLRDNLDITLVDAGTDAVTRYLGMNNVLISVEMREAISYALDYNWIIEELTNGEAERMRSPIPQGILYAKQYDVPETDIEYARSIINYKYGLTLPLDDDESWQALAEHNPIEVFKFNYHWGANNYRMPLLYILQHNLKKIGVNVLCEHISWQEFLRRGTEDRNMLELFWSGWIPDFNDPSNYINPHFANDGGWNVAQVLIDDVQFQLLLQQALRELNPDDRRLFYDQIQQRLVDEFPWCWGYVARNYDAYRNEFEGFQSNPMERVWFYTVKPTWLDITPPTIFHDTIPEEVEITYTRSAQIIGAINAYDFSKIAYVGWAEYADPGFSLITTYNDVEESNIYISETLVMTTNLLESGMHPLKLMIMDAQWNVIEKVFTVEVYRQAELKLSGEFDYLERERVKISIVAQVLDAEDKFLVDPSSVDITVHIKIFDYDDNIKMEDSMYYNPDGFFHWDSIFTINDLRELFPKGIYRVLGWVEFSPSSYYVGGNDVVQFHIDPPGDTESNSWIILEILSFGGLITGSIALAFLFLRERRRRVG